MNAALTLERRLTLWAGLMVALALVTCGGGGAWFLYHKTVAQLDRQIQQVAAQFFEQNRLHGGMEFERPNQHEIAEWLPAPGADVFVELEQRGTIFFRSPRLEGNTLPNSGTHFGFVWTPLGRMRTGMISEEDITMRVAVPAEQLTELMRNLMIVFALGLPAVIGFVVLGGRSVARQALAPVRHIADSAEQITSQQLDRRVPVPDPPDEIRRLALVLNATLDRLETSFRQAQHFSADASHELKTPLATLHAELEAVLAAPALGEKERAVIADALDTTKRLAAIVSSLLLLARADAGHLQLELQPVDLASVLNDCLDDTRIIAEVAGLSVETETVATAQVRGDATRLRQIISNLLDNAVKYNASRGRIRLSLAPHNRSWRIEVANAGPGIPVEHFPRIFDRFYRVEHHAQVSGHGLGLAISFELARAHGGTLELVRSDGTETVFRLTLPRSPSHASEERANLRDGEPIG